MNDGKVPFRGGRRADNDDSQCFADPQLWAGSGELDVQTMAGFQFVGERKTGMSPEFWKGAAWAVLIMIPVWTLVFLAAKWWLG